MKKFIIYQEEIDEILRYIRQRSYIAVKNALTQLEEIQENNSQERITSGVQQPLNRNQHPDISKSEEKIAEEKKA